MKKIALLFILFLLFAGAVWGQAIFVWTGADGDDWDNENNWKDDDDAPVSNYPGQAPSIDDVVIISNFTGNIQFSSPTDITIGDLTIESGSNVSIDAKGIITVENLIIDIGSELSIDTNSDNIDIGTLTLGGKLGIDSSGGNISFNDITGQGEIELDAGTGDVSFTGTIGTSVTSLGNISVNGAAITFSDDVYANDISVTGDVEFEKEVHAADIKITGGTITFDGDIFAADVSVTGTVEFIGEVNVTELNVDGDSTINADINSTTVQTYNGTVKLGDDVELTGSTVTIEDAIIGASHALTITGNGVINGGSGISNLTVTGTLTNNGTLDLGSANLSANTLTNSGLIKLQGSQTVSIVVPAARVGGTIQYQGNMSSTWSFGYSYTNLVIDSSLTIGAAGALDISGSADFGSAITAGSLLVGGNSTIGANITTTGVQTYSGNVTLVGTGVRTLTGSTVSLGQFTGPGAGLSLTITGDGVLNGGSGIGALTVSENFSLVGSSLTAATVSVNGTSNISENINTATGAQTYTGAVTLGGTGTRTLTGSTVTLGTVIGATHALTIDGNGVLNGGSGIGALTVSGNFSLSGGSLTATTINVNGTSNIAADITTTGANPAVAPIYAQYYNGAVTLDSNVNFTGIASSTVYFNDTVNEISPAKELKITTANAVFNNTAVLGSVNVTIGTTVINDDIATTGNQSYGGAVTLGGMGTRILTGSTVTLGTVTGATHALTINGNGVLNGGSGIGALTVGGNFSLSGSSLTAATVSVTGTSNISENISTATGVQTYAGNVTLGGNIVLTGSTVTLGDINGAGRSLTITGNGDLNGGGVTGALTVSGNFSLSGSSLTAATINVTQTSDISADITTTGNQTYTGAVTLDSSRRTITSQTGNIVFSNTLTSSDIIELSATGGIITVSGKITASQLIATALGDVTVYTAEISSSGSEGEDAAIYINADDFKVTGPASPPTTFPIVLTGTGGQLCLVLNKLWVNSDYIDGDEDDGITTNPVWHQHIIDLAGKHLVYGAAPSSELLDLISPDYVHILESNVRTMFVLDPDYNVYINNISSDKTSGLTFETKGTGTIEFIGTNTFKKITLKSESGDINFDGQLGTPSKTIGEITAVITTGTNPGVININSNITTTGAQTYTGAVTFGGAGTLRTLTGSTVTLGSITGNGKSLTIAGNGVLNGANGVDVLSVSGAVTINSDITTTGAQTYTGAVTLGGAGALLTLTGSTVTLGNITGNGKSLKMTDNGILNGGSGIGALTVGGNFSLNGSSLAAASVSVTGTSNISGNINTGAGAQTYSGAVTLGGSDALLTLNGSTVTLGNVTGNGKSLTITGNGILNGGSGINALSVSGSTAINANITTTGNQSYSGVVTVGGTGKRTITSQNGDIEFGSTLTSTGVIELSATSGNITIAGATNAYQLIAKAPNGTVSVNAVSINTSNDGNEGENAAIYIVAKNFVVSTMTANSIVPGGTNGHLCLVLNSVTPWANPNNVINGSEGEPGTPGARWHQHLDSNAPGKILYSFTEDLNGNGKLDRIRVQTNKTLNGDFTGFDVSIVGYEVDTTKPGTVNGFVLVSTGSPDNDSFYIYIKEKSEFDGDKTPLWSIINNTTLKDTGAASALVGSQTDKNIQPIDTIPVRITYTLTLPGQKQTYVQLSEPAVSSSGPVTATFNGVSTTVFKSAPTNLWYLFEHNNTYGVDALANLSIDAPVVSNGYFQMNNMVDRGTKPSVIDSNYPPKYPLDWGYTAYAKEIDNPAVLTPPNKLLGVLGKPDNNEIRRVTDVLVSMTPNATGDNYFAWTMWAKPTNENRSIMNFDGTAYLEKGSIEEGGIELQVRIKNTLTIIPQLFWTTKNIPSSMRNPKEASEAKKVGGLWLPNVVSNPLYNYVPLSSDINPPILANNSSPLFNYTITPDKLANSGARFEFIFRSSSTSDMFIARLDAPLGVVPSNWYECIRPFSFDIQGLRYQRGGVTIMNNVINSDKKETAHIHYDLPRTGRVTVQIYTLDGTLVKSIRRNENREDGSYVDTWDGSNNGGRAVARGMYFVRVVGPDIDEIRKIMVVK